MPKAKTALAVVENEPARETLHVIETELRELIDLRESFDPETEGEAIAATDTQIQAFVGREIRKVTSIAAIMRWFASQAAAAQAEEDHAALWRKRWQGRYDRLKNMVHGIMIAMELPKLEGATDRFRRQNNPEAVEVFDVATLPDEYLKATIRMPLSTWKFLIETHRLEPNPEIITVTSDVDTTKLKKALQARVECHYCLGVGERASDGGVHACENCEGTGQVSATVPGARLSRGEHLRVE